MSMALNLGEAFIERWRRFYERHAPEITLVWGTFMALMAALLVVVSLFVLHVEKEASTRRIQEKEATAIACNRSQVLSPLLLRFFEDTQHGLGFEDITKEQFLFYRLTIPKHCPPLPEGTAPLRPTASARPLH